MTKILDFKTELGDFSIELINNNFVNNWVKHFLKVSSKYNLTANQVWWPYYDLKSVTDFNNAVDNVMSSINFINSLSYITPLPESVTKEQLLARNLSTQQLLNRLHRYVVVGGQTLNRWFIDGEPVFDTSKFPEEFNYATNLLNQNIHTLELYIHTPNKEKFLEAWKFSEIRLDASKYDTVTIYSDDVDVSISDDMFSFLKLTGYDVWIKKDLLGKDFITAFLDHDDPSQFDVRPPTMYSGAIHINMNNNKDTMYQSEEFISWLGSSPTDFHGSYPLGNILGDINIACNCKTIAFIGCREI